jgi:hypothetical protein
VRHGDKAVPCGAAGVDDFVVAVEDPVGEVVLAEVFPEILDRVEFGAVCGSGIKVMLSGTMRLLELCQPAPSRTSRACAPGATCRLLSARWAFIASVFACGMTSAAPVARSGQTAPKM